jgi:hypothetical protein
VSFLLLPSLPLCVAVSPFVFLFLLLCRSPSLPSPKSLCETPVAIVADIDGDVVEFVVANVENGGGGGGDSTLGPDQERTTADQRDNSKKEKEQKGMFSRFFGGSKKKKNANEEIDVDISGATTGKNGSVQYLTRDEVYVLRLAHDFLLEQFGAGGSNFGVQASLAKRELGGEVVCLTEMWLDRQEVDPLVMKESGKGLGCGFGLVVGFVVVWFLVLVWLNS